MINQRLQNAYRSLTNWCARNDVVFDQVCDEDDLQGYLIPKAYDELIPSLTSFLDDVAIREGLHCREQRTRSGTIFAMSLMAIAETTIDAIIPAVDRSRLARRLDLAFGDAAQVVEAQYHAPSTVQKRQYSRPTQTIGNRLNKRLKEDLGFVSIGRTVKEALDGIAADFQPIDVLKQFELALRELGLLDTLKQAGVSNKLSSDKQVIHFYIADEEGQQREVASYELVKLAEGNSMEKAIKDLMDMSRKRAPGTTDRELDQIKSREQQIRDVAKQHSLEDQQKASDEQTSKSGPLPGNNVPIEDIKSRFASLLNG